MAHPVDVHVGKKLKQIRALRRMSQTELAQKLNLNFQQIQKYEIASNRIAASRLYALSEIFNVPPSYFFEGLAPTTASSNKLSKELASALDSIEDEATKERVRRFVQDVSGTKPQ